MGSRASKEMANSLTNVGGQDEVFHVRQAEAYWTDKWHVWDPKITTPPGLYVSYLLLPSVIVEGCAVFGGMVLGADLRRYALSYAWLWILRLCRVPVGPETFIQHLRSINLLGLAGIYAVCRRLLLFECRRGRIGGGGGEDEKSAPFKRTWSIEHTALNICLFPPLFFFCGLFYTDVISVLLVLLTYDSFHRRSYGAVVVFGILSLTLRQTNIFWTAVYLAGLEVLRGLNRGREGVEFRRQPGFLEVMGSSWKHGHLYDPFVGDAWFEGSLASSTPSFEAKLNRDYLKTTVSLGIAAVSQLHSLVLPVVQYVFLLLVFSGFILINGGVVLGMSGHGAIRVPLNSLTQLGDKENHIASLHLPQMLYIWPYIAFFSLPILPPSLVPILLSLLPSSILTALPSLVRFNQAQAVSASRLPRLTLLLTILVPTLTIVHFNTLIHPFTLADNRHYTFYVFRLLRRHAGTKYFVTPLYLLFGWASIQSLTPPPRTRLSSSSTEDPKAAIIPSKNIALSSPSVLQGTTMTDNRDSGERISFALLWLLTSSLTLITAPLVEPRYFILPWLIWRLHVPLPEDHTTATIFPSKSAKPNHDPQSPASTSSRTTPESTNSSQSRSRSPSWNLWETLLHPRTALWLETAWLLVLNVGTGYVFLKWGFEWKQEAGKVQRFMW